MLGDFLKLFSCVLFFSQDKGGERDKGRLSHVTVRQRERGMANSLAQNTLPAQQASPWSLSRTHTLSNAFYLPSHSERVNLNNC